jgi:hypothetical protein
VASPWTPELRAKAADLYKMHSASVIAGMLWSEDRISVSRNAVIGVLHRAGQPAKPRTPKEPKARDRRRDGDGATAQRINRTRRGEHHAVLRIAAGGNGGRQLIQAQVRDVTPRLRCVEVDPLLLTFAELPESGCKYPYGNGEPADFRFCGHPRLTYQRNGLDAKSAYCGAHFGITLRQDSRSERFVTREFAA